MTATLALEQQALLAALWADDAEVAIKNIAPYAVLARAGGLNDSATRLRRGLLAYRSHGRELAVRALQSAYPVLARLLDEDNFAPLARAFWQALPPKRGDLACWGDALPQFVQRLPQLASEPFLADVARVEWALHSASTAADASIDVASFGLLTTHDALGLSLCLSPGLACVASDWPVVSIINAHVSGEPPLAEAARLLRERTGETALLWRDGLRPRVRQAAPGEAAFVAALQGGACLLDALAQAGALDFNAWLAPAVQSALLLGAAPHNNPQHT